MKKFLCLLISLCVSACASLPPSQKFTVEDKSFPSLNVATTQELGDTLVSYIRATSAPSFRPVGTPDCFQNLEGVYGGMISKQGVLKPISETKRYDFYETTGSAPAVRFCYDKEKVRWRAADGMGKCDAIALPSWFCAEGSFEPATYVDLTQPNFRQELIYNGKVGNAVRFLYRELSGGYLRDAFTQEIQYDLSEGSEIGFKGARLKVLNATNRSITYEVSKHFDIGSY